MPALDFIHDAVKKALIKDGWTITHDPYTIIYKDLKAFVDLGAERQLAAERDGTKIAVEIKSFLTPSPIQAFEMALGQYLLYDTLLDMVDPDRKLYLAISQETFEQIFSREAIQEVTQKAKIALLVVDDEKEEICLWKI
jgi:hypothetical protein